MHSMREGIICATVYVGRSKPAPTGASYFWEVTGIVWGEMFQPRRAICGLAFDGADEDGYSISISRASLGSSET